MSTRGTKQKAKQIKSTKQSKKSAPPVKKRGAGPPKKSKRNMKVATASKGQIVEVATGTGSVSKYTKAQLAAIKVNGQKPPENYVRLAVANNITFTNIVANGGVRANWEGIAESVIAASIAHSPLELIPGGTAVLKFYLWWSWFSRVRLPEVQGIMPGPTGTSAQFAPTVLQDFNERDWFVPTGWGKFVQSMMPYKHPNGAVYQYIQDWDNFFPATGTTIPALSSPSIEVGATTANVFNRSLFGNSYLRQATLPVGAGVIGEYNWGIDPNSEAVNTLTILINHAPAISKYWRKTSNVVRMFDVPKTAFDGTFYSYVNSANSTFPGIVSNIEYIDDELSYIYHLPQDPATALAQAPQMFKVLKPLPSVLPQIVPTNVSATTPAHEMMTINYAQVCRDTMWSNGGRRSFIRGCHTVYPNLRSFMPNYYMIDLNGWHQMKEDAIDLMFQNVAYSPVNLAADPRTPSGWQAVNVALESCLLARVLPFSWPSLIFFSGTDLSSGLAYSSQYKTLNLPPLLADYISGLRPCVTDGILYTPLLDYRYSSFVSPGTNFWGLDTATDWVNGRWVYQINPNNLIQIPGGVNYPEVYTPSTAIATASIPPTSLDRLQPYGSGNFISAGNGPIAWAGLVVTQAGIYAGALSPIVPVAASRYIGSTPIRYVHDNIGFYKIVVGASDSSFIPAEDYNLGVFANFNPVTAASTTLFPANALQAAGTFASLAQIQYQVQEVGSAFPLDAGSIGRAAVFAYKRSASIQMMPYAMTTASSVTPVYTLLSNSMRVQGFNTWNTEFEARVRQHDISKLQAVRSMFEEQFADIASNTSTDDYSVGDAISIILKLTQHISVSPYHSGKLIDVASFNSPNLPNQARLLASGMGRIPFLSPISDFLGDLLGGLFGAKVGMR